jgi:predicted nucleotidyltransferase
MRLTDQQLSIIKTAANEFFGVSTGVWLFGSRVDDAARGGDIDLYIEPATGNVDAIVDAKLRFMMEMHKKLGEQKVDVVIFRPESNQNLPIYQVAKQSGIKLL